MRASLLFAFGLLLLTVAAVLFILWHYVALALVGWACLRTLRRQRARAGL